MFASARNGYELHDSAPSLWSVACNNKPSKCQRACAVLSGNVCAIPKLHSGAAEAMRIVSVARRSAVKVHILADHEH